jgi:hypothetical protein
LLPIWHSELLIISHLCISKGVYKLSDLAALADMSTQLSDDADDPQRKASE